MPPADTLSKLIDKHTSVKDQIYDLLTHSIPFAITGSTSLYLHGGFGREPNDIDLYTNITDLEKIAQTHNTETKQVSFPPVSWVELSDKKSVHILAQLMCHFKDGSTYDFSFSDYLKQSLKTYLVYDSKISVVPPEEVLLLKLTAPRKSETKDDIADVKKYLEHNKLDTTYFKTRAREIGVLEIVSNFSFITL